MRCNTCHTVPIIALAKLYVTEPAYRVCVSQLVRIGRIYSSVLKFKKF